jgi:UMF1 family MFS transporter
LVGWTLLGVAGTAALGFVGEGEWWWAAVCLMVAAIGANAANIFYDALLLDVSEPQDYDRVSALDIRSATSAAGCCSRSTS